MKHATPIRSNLDQAYRDPDGGGLRLRHSQQQKYQQQGHDSALRTTGSTAADGPFQQRMLPDARYCQT